VHETWRVIPSLPTHLASSEGRLMKVPVLGEMPHGGSRQYGGQPTWGVWNKQDARFIYQYEGRTYKVARLVCEAFHGAPPADDSVCMHVDENAANNRAANLAWGTQKENLNAPGFLNYCRGRTGENSPTAKSRREKV